MVNPQISPMMARIEVRNDRITIPEDLVLMVWGRIGPSFHERDSPLSISGESVGQNASSGSASDNHNVK